MLIISGKLCVHPTGVRSVAAGVTGRRGWPTRGAKRY